MQIEIMETLLDHVILTVKNPKRSIAFYAKALKPLGIVHALDYDGKNGPMGHPDLKGFGRDGGVFFWSGLTVNPSATVQRPFANAPANCPTRPAKGISRAAYRSPAFGLALSLSISTATVE
jgi:catechol 2,3-dioxygenase-like lactoylglutathione lyase family enzyme